MAYHLFFGKLLLEAQSGLSHDYFVLDGFLFRGSKLYIPDCSLRRQVIKELDGEGPVG